MAVAVIRSVVIVDDSMYHGKGIVIRWVGIVTRKFARDARLFAPMRSGRLKAGIRAGTPRNPFRKVVQGTISSSAPHTMYVLKGTHGPIMSNALWAAGGTPGPGRKMAVGRNLWPPVTPMFVVSGQRANNFMAKAWASTGAAHPAIRGLPFPINL